MNLLISFNRSCKDLLFSLCRSRKYLLFSFGRSHRDLLFLFRISRVFELSWLICLIIIIMYSSYIKLNTDKITIFVTWKSSCEYWLIVQMMLVLWKVLGFINSHIISDTKIVCGKIKYQFMVNHTIWGYFLPQHQLLPPNLRRKIVGVWGACLLSSSQKIYA